MTVVERTRGECVGTEKSEGDARGEWVRGDEGVGTASLRPLLSFLENSLTPNLASGPFFAYLHFSIPALYQTSTRLF